MAGAQGAGTVCAQEVIGNFGIATSKSLPAGDLSLTHRCEILSSANGISHSRTGASIADSGYALHRTSMLPDASRFAWRTSMPDA